MDLAIGTKVEFGRYKSGNPKTGEIIKVNKKTYLIQYQQFRGHNYPPADVKVRVSKSLVNPIQPVQEEPEVEWHKVIDRMNEELAEEQERNKKEEQKLRDRIKELEEKLKHSEIVISDIAERYEQQACAECGLLVSVEWICPITRNAKRAVL